MACRKRKEQQEASKCMKNLQNNLLQRYKKMRQYNQQGRIAKSQGVHQLTTINTPRRFGKSCMRYHKAKRQCENLHDRFTAIESVDFFECSLIWLRTGFESVAFFAMSRHTTVQRASIGLARRWASLSSLSRATLSFSRQKQRSRCLLATASC